MAERAERGPNPRQERRRRAAALRAQGLTMPEIGRRLGVTKQGVAYLLGPKVRRRTYAVACSACGRVLWPDGSKRDTQGVLCLDCLGALPATTFGQRLRAV